MRKRSKFLRFVEADLEKSESDFGSDYVRELQKTVKQVKEDRDMEERQLVLDLVIKDHMKEERARINQLNSRLIEENRLEDLKRSAEDPEFQQQLLEEYHLD